MVADRGALEALIRLVLVVYVVVGAAVVFHPDECIVFREFGKLIVDYDLEVDGVAPAVAIEDLDWGGETALVYVGVGRLEDKHAGSAGDVRAIFGIKRERVIKELHEARCARIPGKPNPFGCGGRIKVVVDVFPCSARWQISEILWGVIRIGHVVQVVLGVVVAQQIKGRPGRVLGENHLIGCGLIMRVARWGAARVRRR